MKCIKSNGATILKLVLNHVVSSVYSLVLFLIFYSISDSRYIYLGSLISICFYFGLIYSIMWHTGAKDANSFYHNDIKKTDGILLMTVASVPTIITNLVACISALFKSDVEFAERTVDLIYPVFYYINYLFTQCMYSGLFISLNNGAFDVSPWWYLLSILPGIAVGAFAYAFGFKSFRLRTLIGIKFDEEKEKIKNKSYLQKQPQ